MASFRASVFLLTRGCRFGAVLEEFELRDALESVLPWEPEAMEY